MVHTNVSSCNVAQREAKILALNLGRKDIEFAHVKRLVEKHNHDCHFFDLIRDFDFLIKSLTLQRTEKNSS